MWCIRKAGIRSQDTCSSSVCVHPPLGIPETLFKMNSGRWPSAWGEEGFARAMLPIGAGLQKVKDLLLLQTHVSVLSVLRAEWVNILNSFSLV